MYQPTDAVLKTQFARRTHKEKETSTAKPVPRVARILGSPEHRESAREQRDAMNKTVSASDMEILSRLLFISKFPFLAAGNKLFTDDIDDDDDDVLGPLEARPDTQTPVKCIFHFEAGVGGATTTRLTFCR